MENTFGQKLKRWREAANVSQSELARRMEVSPTWVSNLERDFSPTAKGGKPQPSVEMCDKIARALGVKIAEVRLAAGYAAPSRNARELEPEPDIRANEAQRAAELIENFLTLPPEKQTQVLALIRVIQAGHTELLEMIKPPIKIVKASDLTESDAEEDTG